MELFKLFGTLGLKGVDSTNKDLDNVTKNAQNSSDKMYNAFKRIGTIVASVFAIDKIKDFGVKMVQTAGEVQAENAQFEASFGDLKDTATDMFNRVSEATGVFATRLQVTGTKAFSQMKGAGMDANEALAKTETYLNLASDAAAYYDISLEEADTRIRSFMRGNVEAGDAIGLFTSESQRNTYALEMYGRKWIELTEAEKQNLMLNVAQDIYKQSGAIGQAQREADGLANVTGNLKEVWRQFLATIGTPVMQAVIPIMQNLTEKLKGLKGWVEENKQVFERIGQVISNVVGIIWNLIEGVISLIGWFQEHKTITTILISVITALVAGFTAYHATVRTITAVTQAWNAIQKILNTTLSLNPIGLVVAGIVALIAVGTILYKKSESFRNFINTLWQGIKSIIGALVPMFKNAFNMIIAVGKPVISFFVGMVNTIASILSPVINIFSKVFNGILAVIKPPVNGIIRIINFIIDALNALSFDIPDWVPFIGGQHFGFNLQRINYLAKGGILTEPTLLNYNPYTGTGTVGGEAGDEAIAPIGVLQSYIGDAVRKETGNLASSIDRLYDMLVSYLALILESADKDIVLDSGVLVGNMIKKIDKQLGNRSNMKLRGNV
ncbi:MAG: hypothetical protein MSS83_05440 [Methanobrevibacter sp.]|uniref:hypothetical protein n=1 Tax=Methanobrevibacter sp. TaxID=66852 RepID=UPI0031F53D5C|nr:hypothetical protein [Methanobrevibacter sp.]